MEARAPATSGGIAPSPGGRERPAPPPGGLTEAEARARLEREGPNELPARERHGLLGIVLEVVREPMFLLLVAAGAIYLAVGEPVDALLLLGFVLVVMGITVVQERRTERALEALRDLSSPRALVVRDGHRRRIPGREVVRGDLLVLAEGDRVPADALLRGGTGLSADESLLTGESVPVRKRPAPEAGALDRPGGDDLPSLFSGTLVTAGQGQAEVLATGARSELGQIGKALQAIAPERTPLQRETARLVRVFAWVGLTACAVVVVAYALTRGGGHAWKEGLLAGIAMAMATLPEEFPVVLTVFLALGAWRISRSNVLTRRIPAIESLGAATVLCVDKTGTLTQNRMAVRRLWAGGLGADLAGAGPLPPAAAALLRTAALASRADPFDPMERAIHDAAAAAGGAPLHGPALLRDYPLTPELLAVSQAWDAGGGQALVACKGAPEAIARLCRLPAEARAALLERAGKLAAEGLRVLGVASARVAAALPARQEELRLELQGLVGLEDPLRPGVPAAVAECRTAGIRVVMITGDYPATALSIARQAGIDGEGEVITGPALAAMGDAELARRIGAVQVFARVVPQQKLRIVEALKAAGEVVAMTGDGVNDAPALKAAHIGIAMGSRGTDVAREAASLVLLDDDFTSIVAAVRLGRRIFDNVKKAVAFILAVHVPIAGLSMLPIFSARWPLLLLPIHIVFLELVIDPACTLVFEAEAAESTVMRRPPRDPAERLFSWRSVLVPVLLGLGVLAACVAVFLLARPEHGADTARALTFTTLVISLIAVILATRSTEHTILGSLLLPNPAVWWVVGGAAAFLALALTLPQARRLFHFAPLHLADLAVSAAAGIACVVWVDLLKLVRRRVGGAR